MYLEEEDRGSIQPDEQVQNNKIRTIKLHGYSVRLLYRLQKDPLMPKFLKTRLINSEESRLLVAITPEIQRYISNHFKIAIIEYNLKPIDKKSLILTVKKINDEKDDD